MTFQTAAATLVLTATLAAAQPVGTRVDASFAAPDADRWNYPFNATPGTRTTASTFGALNTPGVFDDYDAQYLLGFDTGGRFREGLGAENYEILSATLTLTLGDDGEFAYSDTFSQGESIDLYGTGFRNGFTAETFAAFGPFSFGDPTPEGVRNAYATDFEGGVARDVSNFVRDGLDVDPFAVGRVEGATSGQTVSNDGQTVTFDLDLTDEDVVLYLQQALDAGYLSLSVASLHTAGVQGQGGVTFPFFLTSEGGAPASLAISANVIPAPGVIAIAAGGGILAARRRR